MVKVHLMLLRLVNPGVRNNCVEIMALGISYGLVGAFCEFFEGVPRPLMKIIGLGRKDS